MKNSIINRYDKNQNNELVIKISAAKVEDLFEDYDKKSTFIKKDLKESLEKYLIQSVEEIGMKIAILIQCHKNPIQMNLLLERLNHLDIDC